MNSEKTRAEAAIRELKSQIIHVLDWVHIELADLSSISGASFFVLLNSNVQRVSVVARQDSGDGGGVGLAVSSGNCCHCRVIIVS